MYLNNSKFSIMSFILIILQVLVLLVVLRKLLLLMYVFGIIFGGIKDELQNLT